MTVEKKQEQMKLFVIALLALNLLFGIYTAFIKPDAYALESLKAGGRENMKMAKQLYKSDMYIQQQKSTLEQILGSMDQAQQPEVVQPTAEETTPTVELPGVTEEVPTVTE